MPKRIIHPNGVGGIAVTTPATNCDLTLEQIAVRAVPEGIPYKIIDTTDLPADRIQRNLWTADFSTPDGYGGAK